MRLMSGGRASERDVVAAAGSEARALERNVDSSVREPGRGVRGWGATRRRAIKWGKPGPLQSIGGDNPSR
jgi:hypothetical protein